jgi:hypothetical protein
VRGRDEWLASACEDSRRSKATCSIGQLQQWSREEVDVEVAKGRERVEFREKRRKEGSSRRDKRAEEWSG